MSDRPIVRIIWGITEDGMPHVSAHTSPSASQGRDVADTLAKDIKSEFENVSDQFESFESQRGGLKNIVERFVEHDTSLSNFEIQTVTKEEMDERLRRLHSAIVEEQRQTKEADQAGIGPVEEDSATPTDKMPALLGDSARKEGAKGFLGLANLNMDTSQSSTQPPVRYRIYVVTDLGSVGMARVEAVFDPKLPEDVYSYQRDALTAESLCYFIIRDFSYSRSTIGDLKQQTNERFEKVTAAGAKLQNYRFTVISPESEGSFVDFKVEAEDVVRTYKQKRHQEMSDL